MFGPGESVAMLWVGDRLTVLEQMSMASFLRHGHPVDLYTYGHVTGVPNGVAVCDGRAILPESAIFRYGPAAGDGEGSVACFADLFRFKLLLERGGWWSDTDVVCLRPLPLAQAHCFGWEDAELVNVALLRAPAGSPLMRAAYEEADAARHQPIEWGRIGPHLVTRLLVEMDLQGWTLPMNAFYPVGWPEAPSLFEPDPDGRLWRRLEGAYAVHFWNEILRREGLDKEGRFDESCTFERLRRQYL